MLTHTSKGDVSVPVRTAVLTKTLSLLRGTTISVPAAFVSREILFDFRSEWSRLLNSELSDNSFIAAAAMVLDLWEASGLKAEPKSNGQVTLEATPKILNKIQSTLNIERKEALAVVDLAQTALTRSLGGAFVSPSIVKSALESSDMYPVAPYLPSFTDITGVKKIYHKLYSLYAIGEPFAVIVEYIKSDVSSNPLIGLARSFLDMFGSPAGLSIPARLDFVYQTICTDATITPLITTESTDIPLVRKVVSVQDANFSFSDIMSFYFRYLRVHMGGSDVNPDPLDWIAFKDNVDTGNLLVPALPDFIQNDGSACEQLFSQLVLLSLVTKSATAQLGTARAQINALATEKKYLQDDTFFSYVERWLDALCLVVTCADESAKSIFDIGMNDSIFFPGLKHRYQVLMRAYITKYLSSLSGLSLPSRHPRFVMQPGLLINSGGDVLNFNDPIVIPSYQFKDKETNRAINYVINPIDFSYVSYRRTRVHSGQLFDAPVDVDVRMLNEPLCHLIEPFYFTYFAFDFPYSFMSGLDFRLRAMPTKKILQAGYYEWLKGHTTMDFFSNFQDMAHRLAIPLDIAETYFPGPDTPFCMWTGPLQQFYVWDRTVGPVLEVSYAHTEEERFPPFIADYPFFLEDKLAGITLKKGAGISGVVNASGPNKTEPAKPPVYQDPAKSHTVSNKMDPKEVKDPEKSHTVSDSPTPEVNETNESV